jgi:hypothetical protein
LSEANDDAPAHNTQVQDAAADNVVVGLILEVSERESCLLVLNSVTCTPQWIRQPEAAWSDKTIITFSSKQILLLDLGKDAFWRTHGK